MLTIKKALLLLRSYRAALVAIIKMSIDSMDAFTVTETLSTKGRKNVIRVLKANLVRGRLDGNKEVVLKTFTSHKYALVQEALSEAQLLMSVEHPQVCKMYDCFTEKLGEQFRFAIVMEYFPRGDLEDEIYRRKHSADYWSEADLFHISTGLVDALASLQRKRVCHRDIKPHNIFHSQGLAFKFGDFGVSKKELEGATVSQKTLVGTPMYFSPLCAKAFLAMELGNCETVKHDMYKSDVFSLGLTFLRMASLRSVRGLNSGSQAQIESKVKDLSYSPGFKHVLMQMLKVEEIERLDFLGLEQLLTQVRGYNLLKPIYEKEQPKVEVQEILADEIEQETDNHKALVRKKKRRTKKARLLPVLPKAAVETVKKAKCPRDNGEDSTMSTLSGFESEIEVDFIPLSAPDSCKIADGSRLVELEAEESKARKVGKQD